MGTPTSPYSQQQPLSPPQPAQQPPNHYQQQQQQQQPQQQSIHHPNNQYKYNNNTHVPGPAPGNALYPPMQRLIYGSPLTPPSSEPGSPGSTLPRRTPPPPYPAPGCQQTTNNQTTPRLSSSLPKYNRRNNPELEKRRIHHCDFIGNITE